MSFCANYIKVNLSANIVSIVLRIRKARYIGKTHKIIVDNSKEEMQHLCFRGAGLHPNISKMFCREKRKTPKVEKKDNDLNKYKIET